MGPRLSFLDYLGQYVLYASLFLSGLVTVQQLLEQLGVQFAFERKIRHRLQGVLHSLRGCAWLERLRVRDQRQVRRSRSLRNLSRAYLAVSYYLCQDLGRSIGAVWLQIASAEGLLLLFDPLRLERSRQKLLPRPLEG